MAEKVEKIIIDAGHGGANPGATYEGRRESDDALRLAMAVGEILSQDGFEVVYTRTDDSTQSVAEKAARTGINPATKAKIEIPARKVVKFKAGAELAEKVK